MAKEIKRRSETRRYVRARGPFDGHYLGRPQTPVLIYDLNLGGGFVNFAEEHPKDATLSLQIDLPRQEPVTLQAEAVYHHQFGVAVRFVDVDADTALRLAITINELHRHPAGN